MRDFYVDDLISGTGNVYDALQLQGELREMLTKGGFWLRKWTSNHPALLEKIPVAERESNFPFEFNLDDTVKTLGLLWNPKSDKFTFCLQLLFTRNRRHKEEWCCVKGKFLEDSESIHQ